MSYDPDRYHLDGHFHDVPGMPTSPIIAAVSFAALTAGEVFLIIGGYGWWVLPVAMIVAMFCVMFVGLSWEMGRDIMRINRAAMARPARKTPALRKMLCEDCPHGRRRPEPPPTRRRIDIAGNAYAAPIDAPGSGRVPRLDTVKLGDGAIETTDIGPLTIIPPDVDD
jgi:hypothetical protein